MPRLVNKTDIERQKSYNYTQKRENLIKQVELAKAGKVQFRDAKSLLLASGYSEGTASNIINRPDENKGTIELLNEIWPLKEVIDETKQILQDSKEAAQYGNALKAIDIRLKLGGDYAATKQEVSVNGKIEHEITEGTKDYLEFKKRQLANKVVIDGEIVNDLQ